jgi:hypothetical protein
VVEVCCQLLHCRCRPRLCRYRWLSIVPIPGHVLTASCLPAPAGLVHIDIPGLADGIAVSETLNRSKFDHLTMHLMSEVMVLVGEVSALGAACMAYLPAASCLPASPHAAH